MPVYPKNTNTDQYWQRQEGRQYDDAHEQLEGITCQISPQGLSCE